MRKALPFILAGTGILLVVATLALRRFEGAFWADLAMNLTIGSGLAFGFGALLAAVVELLEGDHDAA